MTATRCNGENLRTRNRQWWASISHATDMLWIYCPELSYQARISLIQCNFMQDKSHPNQDESYDVCQQKYSMACSHDLRFVWNKPPFLQYPIEICMFWRLWWCSWRFIVEGTAQICSSPQLPSLPCAIHSGNWWYRKYCRHTVPNCIYYTNNSTRSQLRRNCQPLDWLMALKVYAASLFDSSSSPHNDSHKPKKYIFSYLCPWEIDDIKKVSCPVALFVIHSCGFERWNKGILYKHQLLKPKRAPHKHKMLTTGSRIQQSFRLCFLNMRGMQTTVDAAQLDPSGRFVVHAAIPRASGSSWTRLATRGHGWTWPTLTVRIATYLDPAGSIILRGKAHDWRYNSESDLWEFHDTQCVVSSNATTYYIALTLRYSIHSSTSISSLILYSQVSCFQFEDLR